jgi:hypothetical protein
MHTFQDWLHLHKLEIDTIQKALLGPRAMQPPTSTQKNSGGSNSLPQKASKIRLDRDDCFHQYVQASLVSFFGCTREIKDQLSAIEIRHIPHGDRPHTIHTEGKSPIVCIAWSNLPEDLICLAHEVAHALQINLSKGAFMPPVAREVCAFIGELILLDWIGDNEEGLSDALNEVWQSETENYLEADADALFAAVSDVTTAYNYNMNYPLARILATHIFSTWDRAQIYNLFVSGSESMSLLPLAEIAKPVPNELPPFPETDQQALSAYRSLGAMVLLDLECWNQDADTVISEYYGALSTHLRAQTAFIGLQQDKRPIGYATWEQTPDTKQEPRLLHLAAPFGDAQALKNMVSARMKPQSPMPDTSGGRPEGEHENHEH